MRAPALALAALAGCAAPVLDETPVRAPRADTDEPRSSSFALDGVPLGTGRAALPLPDGRAVLVDDDARLVLVEGETRAPLLDAVVGRPALLDDARVIAARATDLGESDLWIVPVDGSRPRALAAHAGADGQPFVLDDGRVLFVSDRTGVASVYVVGADGRGLAQLTNASARPGALGGAFVPPPVLWLEQRGAVVAYDAGDRVVRLEVPR